MDYTNNKLNPEILSRFQHLKNLQPMQLELLSSSLHIRSAPKGAKILQRGEDIRRIHFLPVTQG